MPARLFFLEVFNWPISGVCSGWLGTNPLKRHPANIWDKCTQKNVSAFVKWGFRQVQLKHANRRACSLNLKFTERIWDDILL